MELALLFSLAQSLNFSINFDRSYDEIQDCFIFNGVQNSAHLYRSNNTLNLHVTNGSEFDTYQCNITEDMWSFIWPRTINNMEMRLVKGSGATEFGNYNSFLFINGFKAIETLISMPEKAMKCYIYGSALAIVSLLAAITHVMRHCHVQGKLTVSRISNV